MSKPYFNFNQNQKKMKKEKQIVEEKKKIALLTADTYRIAAAEQLRTYANILEVPFRVIYSPEEIMQSVEEYKDYDYILVDTTGHSHQNQEQKTAILDFVNAVNDDIEKEVFLVVSATTKYRDLIRIAESGMKGKIVITDHLVFNDQTLNLREGQELVGIGHYASINTNAIETNGRKSSLTFKSILS